MQADANGVTMDNPSELCQEYSPRLPSDFPKALIPSDLCQGSYMQLAVCLDKADSTAWCGSQIIEFYFCKKKRDNHLFGQLEKWETTKFSKLNDEEKKNYLDNIDAETKEIKSQLSQIPQDIENKNRRWRFESDIQQNEWRRSFLDNST